jgi:hypothetical protein
MALAVSVRTRLLLQMPAIRWQRWRTMRSSENMERRVLLLCATVAAAAACAEKVPHHYQNEGKLCVYPTGTQLPVLGDPPSYSYPADATFDAVVAVKTCLDGCSRDIAASCVVIDSGTELQVTSEGSYVEEIHDSCSKICRPFMARCPTPVLPVGDYLFRHGTNTLVLTLPSTSIAPCVGKDASD